MCLEIFKIKDDEEPELVFEQLPQEDLVWEEEQPGSTHATKIRAIITADESSKSVERLWKTLQTEDNRLEKEGFFVDGHQVYPQFVERLDYFLGYPRLSIRQAKSEKIPG